MAIGTAAAVMGGASILGSVLSAKAAKKGAKAQLQGTQEATAEQRRQYDLTRSDMAPWREAGAGAITSLADMLKPGYDHTTSPGYQFRFSEGQRAVESGGAARGLLMSGGTLKDLTRFGQGVAADDFNQQFNRTASVAAGGQQVNSDLARLGANVAGNIGNNIMAGANARASGYAGQAAAFNNGLGNLAFMGMSGGFGGGFGGGSMPASGWGTPGYY